MKNISIGIIIPVYNEEKTLLKILKKVNELKNVCNLEIIVIDDYSTDLSKEIIINNKVLYSQSIFLKKNYGKGKAVIEGIKLCKSDFIIIQDADLEYNPDDINKFIKLLKNSNADLIMGSRFIAEQRSILHFWHMLGNKFITLLFNILNNTTFTDIYCCYCLFKKNVIDPEKLKCYGWGQQAEILTYAVKKSNKIYEIGINYDARNYDEGKKIKYYDVFSVVYFIIKTKIKSIFN